MCTRLWRLLYCSKLFFWLLCPFIVHTIARSFYLLWFFLYAWVFYLQCLRIFFLSWECYRPEAEWQDIMCLNGVRFAPIGTNHGLFKVTSQNVLKLTLKSPGFVPFGANLTHFGAKLNIPGPDGLRLCQQYIWDQKDLFRVSHFQILNITSCSVRCRDMTYDSLVLSPMSNDWLCPPLHLIVFKLFVLSPILFIKRFLVLESHWALKNIKNGVHLFLLQLRIDNAKRVNIIRIWIYFE